MRHNLRSDDPRSTDELVRDAGRSSARDGLAELGITRRGLLGATGATVAGTAILGHGSVAAETDPAGTSEPDSAIVVFDLEPLARHDGNRRAHEARLAEQRQTYRDWLTEELPDAEVRYEYEIVLNGFAVRMGGHGLSEFRAGPNVEYVARSVSVFPTMGESLGLIDGESEDDMAGEGVKVAIIDTGIEHTHDFFDDTDFSVPDEGTWPRGNGDEWGFDEADFTNDKVIAAYVFWDEEDASLDPGDENRHGTHVAGSAGGRANTETDLGSQVSGVAPGTWLGNYNVFAGDVSTASENIVAAIEQAVADGFDVINMSLGGPISQPEDPLIEASESAIEAGVAVVSSAGNDGPGAETVTSPGAAPNVTAVGASTNARGVFDTLFVTDVDEELGPVAYVPGVDGGEIESEIEGALLVAWEDLDDTGSTTALACDERGPPAEPPDLEAEFGERPVVIVQRGDCAFAEKAQNIKEANGRAMLVYNEDTADEEELVTMTLQNGVEFPSAFITNVDGFAIRDLLDGADDPRIDITFDEAAVDREENVLAAFSSRGPGPDLEIKPELTAPGVNIYSSVINNGWGSLSGTSMASPHAAGAAAVLRATESDWGVPQVRSALVNTAAPAVAVDTGAAGPMSRGNGLLQVGTATDATLLTDPATVSFGALASRGPAFRTGETRALEIRNVSDSAVSVEVIVHGESDPEPTVAVEPAAEIDIGAGMTTTLELNADASNQANGTYWGRLELADGEGTTRATVPFWYRVGR